jgi:hypothetical protein
LLMMFTAGEDSLAATFVRPGKYAGTYDGLARMGRSSAGATATS